MKNTLFIITVLVIGCSAKRGKVEHKYKFNSDSSIIYFDCTYVYPVGRVPNTIPFDYKPIRGTTSDTAYILLDSTIIFHHPMIYGPVIPLDSFNKYIKPYFKTETMNGKPYSNPKQPTYIRGD